MTNLTWRTTNRASSVINIDNINNLIEASQEVSPSMSKGKIKYIVMVGRVRLKNKRRGFRCGKLNLDNHLNIRYGNY